MYFSIANNKESSQSRAILPSINSLLKVANDENNKSGSEDFLVSSSSLNPKDSSKKASKKKTRSNLPKHVIDILNDWLEAHLENPYPTSFEKKELIHKTSLSNVQLSNWFINVRRRKLYTQYYDLKDKTGSSTKKQEQVKENSLIILPSEHPNVVSETKPFAHSKESDYLFMKKRMSLENILNDYSYEKETSKPQKQIFKPLKDTKKTRAVNEAVHEKLLNENKGNEPPEAIIITEANEIRLEEKFKFQPFIKRKKLMDRLYDLKKIYYVTDHEAGLEPMPEPDSDD
ncbi:hypothetical protein QEN19_000458 [Hanseniaspora menglaensis]